MKVLILSANTGTGHNSVAQAVHERFVAEGDECVIMDCLSFVSPTVSKMIASGHSTLYKHFSKLNNWGWEICINNRASMNQDHPAYKLMKLGCEKLALYLLKEKFDIAVCTHIFGGWMLGCTVREHNINIKTGIVETDYMPSLGCEFVDVDYHFVPTVDIADELETLGISREKIIVTGIPVKEEIYKRMSSEEAKKKLNINNDRKHVIVMCGSMGGGPMIRITHHLIKKLGNQIYITVVCGSNRNLYNDMKLAYGLRKNVRITKFIKEMSLWMDSADILISKPGGISTTEAAAKNLPMILINCVGGCENGNLKYFVEKGGALSGKEPEDVAAICRKLLSDEKQCEDMREALRRIAEENDTGIIIRTLKETANRDDQES